MEIRKFVIQLVTKYSAKGADEAEADLEKLGQTTKRATKGLTEHQKAQRAAREEASRLAKAERDAAKALKEQARAAEKATQESKRLAKANAGRLAKNLTAREKKAADAIKARARATAKATREAERFAKATVAAAKATARMATKQQKAAEKAKKLAEAEAKVARETRQAAEEARKASSSWTAIAGEFAAVGGAATAIGVAIAAVALPVLLVGSKFESLRAQLDNLLGSAAAGEKAFSFVQEFATNTPFQLDEVTGSFVKLQGRGIKPTEERLTSLGDIAAANGKTFDDITEAALDATQGEGERLREFGIVMKTVGETVSLSFRGTTIAVDKNQEAITDALTKLGQLEGVAGSMAAQMNTLKGQVSNARDALDQFLNTAAQSGPLERAGDILGDLREKFLDPENARLLGEALDEVFKLIQEALAEVEPETIEAGFKLLLNVLKLLAVVLKPFIALWNQALKLIERGKDATDVILRLAQAISNLATGTITLGDALTEAASALGLMKAATDVAMWLGVMDQAAVTAAVGMDNLRERALGAIDAIKAAVTGSFVESATDDELQAIIANEDAPAAVRNSATKELRNRKNRTSKTQADAKRREDNFRKDRGAARSEFLGAKGKSKGGQFFDFEKQAGSAASNLGEEFAATELERLVSLGVDPREAQAQARAAGKKRAAEKKAQFIKAGKIGDGDNILDILGLRGPGSVLANRPAPQTLLITISPVITFIETFSQTISGGPPARSLEVASGEGGRAAIEAGLEPHRKMFEQIVMAMFNLQGDRLLKAEGGGALPTGPQG